MGNDPVLEFANEAIRRSSARMFAADARLAAARHRAPHRDPHPKAAVSSAQACERSQQPSRLSVGECAQHQQGTHWKW